MNIPSGLYTPSRAIYNYAFVEAVLIYVSSQTGTKIKGKWRYPKPHFIFQIMASLENRSHSLNPYFMRYASELRIKLYPKAHFITG